MKTVDNFNNKLISAFVTAGSKRLLFLSFPLIATPFLSPPTLTCAFPSRNSHFYLFCFHDHRLIVFYIHFAPAVIHMR